MEKPPDIEEIRALVGSPLCEIWVKLCDAIDMKYEMECTWNSGGKAWTYEYKYRRGGKTLCALYAREDCIGFMVIFGKAEREKFEAVRAEFGTEIRRVDDEAATYHDGKWMMFMPQDTSMFPDFLKLLEIKRRPNRK